MRIKHKLPLAAISLTLFAAGATAVSAISVAGNRAEGIYAEKLAAVSDGRRNELRYYLQNIRLDVISLASRPDTTDALRAYEAGWREIGDDAGEELQYRYIEDNPYDAGEKDLMDMAMEGDGYDIAHSTYHGRFRSHLESRGYYDIFLFNNDGDVVYSVLKQDDYATNAASGAFADSGLGAVFRGVRDAPTSGVVSFADFARYAPSNGAAAAFMSAPVFDGLEQIGVLAVQLPVGQIAATLSNTQGLGETGESLLLNADMTLVADSARTEADDTLATRAEADAIGKALGGEAAEGRMTGYRGIETIVSAVPLEFEGVRWAVAAVADTAEVRGIAAQIRNNVLLVAGVLVAIASALGLWFSRSIAGPINRLDANMKALAGGDTEIEISDHTRKDEVGDMARSVVVFRDAALENIRLEEEAAAGRKLTAEEAQKRTDERARVQAEQERALSALSAALSLLAEGDLQHRLPDDMPATFRAMAENYNDAIARLCETMSGTRGVADTLHDVAETLTSASQKLAGRTEEQSASLTETATSLQNLTDSVQSTAQNARSAMDVVGEARNEAEQSRDVMKNAVSAMQGIDESSSKIGNIIGVIDEIAFQTNLLALNAGVEAARAGEAGKGFAVVAQEVRELAQRSGEAAKEIRQLIEESAREVRNGVDHVAGTDKALDGIIARVTELSAMFRQIADSTTEQEKGLNEVSDAVSNLDQITQENSHMAELNSVEIEKLREQVQTLTDRMQTFRMREAETHGEDRDGNLRVA